MNLLLVLNCFKRIENDEYEKTINEIDDEKLARKKAKQMSRRSKEEPESTTEGKKSQRKSTRKSKA